MTLRSIHIPYQCILMVVMTFLHHVADAQEQKLKVPQEIEYLLEDHCWKCHDYGTSKGDVRLDNLGEIDLDSWINLLNRMHEQTHLEIMPPKKERTKPSAE